MKNSFSKLLVSYIALYAIQPAAPVVSLFYCIKTTTEQQITLMAWALGIVVLLEATQALILYVMYRPVHDVLTRLSHGQDVPNRDLQIQARRSSSLPIQVTALYSAFMILCCVLDYAVFRRSGIGALSASSIWGGCIPGATACAFMVLGASSLILGKNTEIFAKELAKRKLEFKPVRMNIFPKLLGCFIVITIGMAAWLAFSAFYTGINQTIEEIIQGDTRFLTAVTSGMNQENPVDLQQRLSKAYPDIDFFVSGKGGEKIAGSSDSPLTIPQWESLGGALLKGLTSKHPGFLYDNVHERVISWVPLGDGMIGLNSYLRDRLPRFISFYIWSTVFIVVGLSVGLILSLTNVLATSRSINRAAEALKDLSQGEGDLSTRLPVTSEDEVGDLARRFNMFSDKLYAIIQKIVEQSRDIRSASAHFTELAQSMDTDIKDLQKDTADISSKANDTSEDLTSVSSGCDETANTINVVAMASDEMASTIGDVAKKTEEASLIVQNAVSTAQTASDKITRLGSAARDISQVTEVITEISEQTNLLALNATIESARAGEAGKGFAVVANEIKDLARQTANATQEIRERILGIQSSTHETVEDMGNISRVISSVNEIVMAIAGAVEEQSATTNEIAQNISQVSGKVVDVNLKVARSSEASQGITSNMEAVHSKAGNIAQNSAMVDERARNLLNISEELNEQLAKFKL